MNLHQHSWSRWLDVDAYSMTPGVVEVFQVRTCKMTDCGLIESRSIPQVLA